MKKFLKSDDFGYTKGLIVLVNVVMVLTIFSFLMMLMLFGFKLQDSEHNLELSSYFNILKPIFVFLFLFIIRKILISVRNRQPFIYDNVKRLRLLGFLFIAIDFGLMQVTWFVAIVGVTEVTEINFFHTGTTGFIAGAIFLVFSEVFRMGIKIKQENELTV